MSKYCRVCRCGLLDESEIAIGMCLNCPSILSNEYIDGM